MRYLLLPIVLAFSVPVVATAEKNEATEKDPDAVRCRAVKELGSRIPKRVCKTNADWARAEAEAREAMANRNRNSHCSGDFC